MNLRFLLIVGLVIQLFWLPTRALCAMAEAPVAQESACAGCCNGCPDERAPERDTPREPCCAACPKCDLRPSDSKVVPSERDAVSRRLLDRDDAPEVTHSAMTRRARVRPSIGAPQYEHPPPLGLRSSVSSITGRWLC